MFTLHPITTNVNEAMERDLRFRAFSAHSGICNLTHSVTINTQSVGATFVYEGNRYSPSVWGATIGENLFISSSTQVPSGSFTPFTDPTARSVKFNNGQVFQATNGQFGNTDTNDFMIEAVFEIHQQQGGAYFAKFATGAGYNIAGSPTSTRFQVVDGLGSVAEVAFNTGAARKWVIFHGFYDHDDLASTGCRAFLEGVSVGTSGHISASSLDSANRLTIGSRSTFTDKTDGHIAYVAMYQKHNWFRGGANNTTDWTNIALERANKIMGIFPQFSSGSAHPSTRTRASTAYLDTIVDEGTGERQMFLVYDNWMRFQKHQEVTGSGCLSGYLSEQARTNQFLWSENFQKDEWIKGNADVNPAQIVAPNRVLSGTAIVPSSDSTTHYIHQQNFFPVSTAHTLSIFAKAGNLNFITLGLVSSTTASLIVSYDLANGRVANVISASGGGDASQNGPFPYIEKYGNGWYRCAISHRTSVAQGTFTSSFYASNDADNSPYVGDGVTPAIYIYGAQLERGQAGGANLACALSYITTTNATAARVADDLRFSAVGNMLSTGSSAVKILCLRHGADSNPYIYDLGTSNTDHILYMNGQNYFSMLIRLAGATQTQLHDTTAVVLDGKIHEARINVDRNDFRFQQDQKLPLTDTDGQPPTIENGTITIGQTDGGSTQQPGYIISDLRFWGNKKK